MNAKKKIGWGILGTGSIACQFAQGLSVLPDAQLIAVGSRRLETAKVFADKFKVKFAYQGYKDLVENPEVDVVYIATPNSKHKEHALLCLNANKPVLCEKPFALNANEAKMVIELARSKNIFCMEAMWTRFMPLVRDTRDLIKGGLIGEPCVLTVNFGSPVAFNPQKDVFNIEMGGGALLDRGVYGISLAMYLFGKPSKVTGKLVLGSSGVDEQAVVSLEYPDGKLAVITASLQTYLSNEAVISGTLGRIKIGEPFFRPHRLGISRFSSPLSNTLGLSGQNFLSKMKEQLWVRKLYLQLGHYLPFFKRPAEKDIVKFFDGNGYGYEAKEVIDCLFKGLSESQTMPLDDSLKVMELMDSVRKQNNFWFPGE